MMYVYAIPRRDHIIMTSQDADSYIASLPCYLIASEKARYILARRAVSRHPLWRETYPVGRVFARLEHDRMDFIWRCNENGIALVATDMPMHGAPAYNSLDLGWDNEPLIVGGLT